MQTNSGQSLLSGLGIDGDTALILALMYLLYKQGADKTLLIALLMILL